MSKEIFKVQLPLTTTDPEPKALVYNEKHTVELYPSIEHVSHLFKKGEAKVFVYGVVEGNQITLLDQRAPWQEW